MPSLPWRRALTPRFLLVSVCVLHGLSSLVLVGAGHGFGADETVYLSQINAHVPAGVFSAPRARGLTLVVAPVTLLTGSVAVTRIYLAAVTSVLMYVGFRTWFGLVGGRVVPLAALLFSVLWTSVYYGYEAMPNIYVALVAVAAVGLTVKQLRDPTDRRRLVAVGLCLAALALLRPSDAGYVLVALLLAVAIARAVPAPARRWLAGALVLGFVVGAAEWVVEAYVRFGGPAHRLYLAQQEQGGGLLHFSLLQEAHALAGPLLCRAGCRPSPPGWAMVWWPVFAALVVVGVVGAGRGRRAALATASGAALALAGEYLVTIGYAAPRFLTPSYALLALPAAAGIVTLVRVSAHRTWLRPAVVAAASAAVVAQTVSQADILRRDVVPAAELRLQRDASLAHTVDQLVGTAHCVIGGPRANAQIAFDAGCSLRPAAQLDGVADGGRDRVVYLSGPHSSPRLVDAEPTTR